MVLPEVLGDHFSRAGAEADDPFWAGLAMPSAVFKILCIRGKVGEMNPPLGEMFHSAILQLKILLCFERKGCFCGVCNGG